MQVFDISLPPGGSRQIDVQAKYIYFLNGSAGGADATIGFRPESGGETVFLKPGQAYKMADSDRYGMRWTMFNLKNEATIVGEVLMGEGEFTDNRVSGDVTVLDNGKARSLAGISFSRMRVAGPVATKFPWVQMFNPVGSGKKMAIKTVVVSSDTAGFAGLFICINDANTGVNYATPKNFGMPDGLMKCSASAGGNYPPAEYAGANNFGVMTLSAGVSVPLPMSDPIILREGFGFGLAHTVAGASVSLIVELEQF